MSEQKQPDQAQKQKPKPTVERVNDLKLVFIREIGKSKYYQERLPYKNWSLAILQTRSDYVIKVLEKSKRGNFARLNILLSDLKYLYALLEDLLRELKKHGIEPAYI